MLLPAGWIPHKDFWAGLKVLKNNQGEIICFHRQGEGNKPAGVFYGYGLTARNDDINGGAVCALESP